MDKRTFLCKFNKPNHTDPQEVETTFASFTEDNGYDDDEIEGVDKLEIGQSFYSDNLDGQTITRIS